jgi:hypothetical protein
MFGTVLIVSCTLMHLYLFFRAASVPFLARNVSRKILAGVGLFLWLVLVTGRIYGRGGSGVWAGMLEGLAMNWMAVLFLGTVAMLTVDLGTGFGWLWPQMAPRLRGWALVAGGLLSLIGVVQGLRPPVVQNYEVRLGGLPRELNGIVLAAVSDLHLDSRRDGKRLTALAAQVDSLEPDLVVLLGDIFEGHNPPPPELLAQLGRLRAPLGVWAVLGNHEFFGGGGDSQELWEQNGLQVLRDRWQQIRPGLVLAGLDDLTTRRRAGRLGDPITTALAGRPAGATILLSHTPWLAEEAARAGVGLMLSGHTHGGQIWPLGYLIRLRYPLLAGSYQVGGLTVIVCRGTGTWGPFLRLWHPNEILKVTLRSG